MRRNATIPQLDTDDTSANEHSARLQFRSWNSALAFVGLWFALSFVVFLIFATQSVGEIRARRAILGELGKFGPTYHVRLNHRDVEDGARLIEAIKRIRQVPPHHSHPTAPIQVEVRNDDGRSFVFVIARDSEVPDEYWVFRPGRNLQGDPRGQEAGRVSDQQLSTYLHRRGF